MLKNHDECKLYALLMIDYFENNAVDSAINHIEKIVYSLDFSEKELKYEINKYQDIKPKLGIIRNDTVVAFSQRIGNASTGVIIKYVLRFPFLKQDNHYIAFEYEMKNNMYILNDIVISYLTEEERAKLPPLPPPPDDERIDTILNEKDSVK